MPSVLAIRIDDSRCCGFGNCESLCPEVFRVDPDTNRAELRREIRRDALDLIWQAVRECPTQAIEITQ